MKVTNSRRASIRANISRCLTVHFHPEFYYTCSSNWSCHSANTVQTNLLGWRHLLVQKCSLEHACSELISIPFKRSWTIQGATLYKLTVEQVHAAHSSSRCFLRRCHRVVIYLPLVTWGRAAFCCTRKGAIIPRVLTFVKDGSMIRKYLQLLE